MNNLARALKRRTPFIVTMVGLATIVGFLAYYVQAQAASRSAVATPPQTVASEEHGDNSRVGWKTHLGSGLDVTLVTVEKHDVNWLFHFTIVNNTNKAEVARGPDMPTPADMSADQSALDRQFVIRIYPRSLTPEYRPLSATPANDQAAHPALPGALVLRPHQRADGWLQVDATQSVGLPPNQLLYIHDPKASMKCPNGGDLSACTPETVYGVMAWLM